MSGSALRSSTGIQHSPRWCSNERRTRYFESLHPSESILHAAGIGSVQPYTRVAAFNLCVEPQMDGRLHLHVTIYGSTFTPGLLTRIAGCADLQPTASAWLDGVSCTRVSEASHVHAQQHNEEGGTRSRSYEIP